jgi:hypothetical protein
MIDSLRKADLGEEMNPAQFVHGEAIPGMAVQITENPHRTAPGLASIAGKTMMAVE